jgi:Flp pilus assembly protein TadG
VRLPRFLFDERGATAVEFALTAPAFFAILFAVMEGGLLLWTQVGLQHGAEAAARCASINTTVCSGSDAIKNYAAQQAFGLNLPASTFSFSTPTCGNQVSATYTFTFLTDYFNLPTITLNAQSCFPSQS